MSETTTIRCHEDCIPVGHRGRFLIAFAIIFVVLALVVGSIQINMSYSFLRSHSKYIHERDAVWAPMLEKIESHMDRQDADAERILKNQEVIMDRLK